MSTLISFFSGKKTYIIGILTIILGLLQGNQEMILNGFAIVFLRAGIAKNNPSTDSTQ